jgi:hypothetical protein
MWNVKMNGRLDPAAVLCGICWQHAACPTVIKGALMAANAALVACRCKIIGVPAAG